ncbi:MAG: ribonuclease HI family protein [Planctomycetota bacterium]
MHCTIHIDGGARGNPGPAGVGVVIQDTSSDAYLHEAGYYLGEATNNVAEYRGLIKGLEVAAELGAKRILVVSDSELVVRQINLEYKVRNANLKPLFERATALLGRFGKWQVTHTRRENNRLADQLANRAMDAKQDVSFSRVEDD